MHGRASEAGPAIKLVHLSDLHLGFRAFPRTERGWNLRERDLAAAFHQAILEIARLEPDVVVISGDIFDRPDPPSTAFLTLTRGLGTLRAHLPSVRVLAIAGARDTPLNPADPGPVAVLDALPGVDAASGAPRAVHIRELGLHALLVPHRAALHPPFPELRPNPDARWNILVIRGEVHAGALSGAPATAHEGLQVIPDGWDYVAVGGAHEAGEVAPRVWVAGSLERTGWDPWREATEEKGFMVFDLGRGAGEFHPVVGRPVVDLAPVRVSSDDPEAGSRRLRDLLDGVPGGVEGKIVRVRLRGDVLLPSEGVAAGLLSAVRRKTAHSELELSGGEGPSTTAERAPSKEATGRIAGIVWGPDPLDRLTLDSGIIALTAPGDAALERVVASLRGEGGGTGDTLLPLGIRLELEGESDAAARRAIFRRGSPEEMLLQGIRRIESRDSLEDPPSESEAPEGEVAAPANDGVARGAALREARADAVEAAGDLEARAMEWARERQDAESHLLAYRDRARELKARLRQLELEGTETLCPTCGVPVGDHLPSLLETLREEWDGVVQDGRWWKRRREQLDDKPTDLQEMEGRAIRLQARVEALSSAPENRSPPPTQNDPPASTNGAAAEMASFPLSPAARSLIRRATSILYRVSEGGLTGMLPTAGGILVEEAGRHHRAPSRGEKAALSWAVRVAGDELLCESGEAVTGSVFEEFAAEESIRFVGPAAECLRGSPLSRGVMVMVLPSSAPGGCSDAFAGIVELREEAEGRASFRRVTSGSPRLFLPESPRLHSSRLSGSPPAPGRSK